ncbi:MAG: hypothetical protein AAFX65_10625 [Cyanobacteria bacterium J06638_7]
MPADIQIEPFDFAGSDGSTYALSADVGALSAAFVRRPGPVDKATGGPTGSTGNIGPNGMMAGLELTSSSQLTMRAGNTVERRAMGEVWRYVGAPGGAHEFVTRARLAVPCSSADTSVSLSSYGITDRNACIPFVTGISTTRGGTSDYDISIFGIYIDDAKNLRVIGVSGSDATVYVDVVEFTGSAWRVGHGISASHDGAAETVTLNTDSRGTGGATFNVFDWGTAFIADASMAGDNGGETGICDVLPLVYPAGVTTQVVFDPQAGDAAARNDNTGYLHVLQNDDLSITRDASNQEINEGNGSYGTIGFPAGTPTDRALDELALELTVTTSGAGSAHGRGRLQWRITDAAGTLQHWVHRSGNNVVARIGVLDLSGLVAPPPSSQPGNAPAAIIAGVGGVLAPAAAGKGQAGAATVAGAGRTTGRTWAQFRWDSRAWGDPLAATGAGSAPAASAAGAGGVSAPPAVGTSSQPASAPGAVVPGGGGVAAPAAQGAASAPGAVAAGSGGEQSLPAQGRAGTPPAAVAGTGGVASPPASGAHAVGGSAPSAVVAGSGGVLAPLAQGRAVAPPAAAAGSGSSQVSAAAGRASTPAVHAAGAGGLLAPAAAGRAAAPAAVSAGSGGTAALPASGVGQSPAVAVAGVGGVVAPPAAGRHALGGVAPAAVVAGAGGVAAPPAQGRARAPGATSAGAGGVETPAAAGRASTPPAVVAAGAGQAVSPSPTGRAVAPGAVVAGTGGVTAPGATGGVRIPGAAPEAIVAGLGGVLAPSAAGRATTHGAVVVGGGVVSAPSASGRGTAPGAQAAGQGAVVVLLPQGRGQAPWVAVVGSGGVIAAEAGGRAQAPAAVVAGIGAVAAPAATAGRRRAVFW